jgi:hypothetical protein
MSRGRARPQLLRVEQTRSELVFGMPAPGCPILKGGEGSRLMGWTVPRSLIEFVRPGRWRRTEGRRQKAEGRRIFFGDRSPSGGVDCRPIRYSIRK